jgi:outer membrane protein assembly factor BamB
MTKTRKIFLPILLIVTASVFLSACTGQFLPEGWPGMVIEGDTLFVAYGEHVYFLNENGSQTGQFPQERINGATFFAPPLLLDETTMIAGSYAGSLYKFNPATGAQIGEPFSKNQSRFLATPLHVNNVLFLPDTDHFLYALDLNFNEIWKSDFNQPLWSAPVIDGQVLYHTSIDNQLYAINSLTGTVMWQEDLGGTMLSAPTLSENGLLYIGTFNKEVIAFDPVRQHRAWTFTTNESVWASPVIANDMLFATDLEGYVYALDLVTGELIWQVDVDGRITGEPLIVGESLYVGTESGTLAALNIADGSLRWQRSVPGEDAKAYSSPVAWGEDMILFGIVDADQVVMAYDSNGTLLWEFTPRE